MMWMIGGIGLVTGRSPHGAIFPVLVPVLAVLVTWLTGSVNGQGLPMAWKVTGVACLALGCPKPTDSTDWLGFGLDVIFYAAIGYGLLLVYSRYHVGKPASAPHASPPGDGSTFESRTILVSAKFENSTSQHDRGLLFPEIRVSTVRNRLQKWVD